MHDFRRRRLVFASATALAGALGWELAAAQVQENEAEQTQLVAQVTEIVQEAVTGTISGIVAVFVNSEVQSNPVAQSNAFANGGVTGEISQENRARQTNAVESRIAIDNAADADDGIVAVIVNSPVEQANALGQENDLANGGTAGGLAQSNKGRQGNALKSEIAIANDGVLGGDIVAVIVGDEIEQTNGLVQANDAANGGTAGDLAQSNKSRQGSVLKSVISIDNGGALGGGMTAVIVNDVILQSNAQTQANAVANGGVAGNQAQSNGVRQANALKSEIAIANGGVLGGGMVAFIDNFSIEQANALVQTNAVANGGVAGDVAQSNGVRQASKLKSRIAIDNAGDAQGGIEAFIANLSNVQSNFDAQTNAVANGGVAGGQAQSNRGSQANRIESEIIVGNGGSLQGGTAAGIENFEIGQSNFLAQTNAVANGGTAGDQAQSNEGRQANTVESLITIDNAADADGIEAFIGNGFIEQSNFLAQTNAVANGGSIGDTTQDNVAGQANLVLSTIAVDNGGKLVAGETGIFANIVNEEISQSNAAVLSNSVINAGVTGDVALAFGGEQANLVRSTIALGNGGKVIAGTVGLHARIENLAISQSNTAVANNATILVTGEATGGGTFDQSNLIESVIAVDNGGSVRAQGIGILAEIVGDHTEGVIRIDNSGVVIGETDAAIRLVGGNDNRLNLYAPAYLGGVIDLGDGGTAVDITTGRSHSVLWDFSTGNLTGLNFGGAVPGFYNPATRQFATFDPTALTADLDQLGDLTGMMSWFGRSRLGTFAMGADIGEEQGDGPPAELLPSRWWVAGSGGAFDYDANGAALARDTSQWGLAVGYNWRTANGLDLGVMGGYVAGSLEAASPHAQSYDNDVQGFFAGLNGRHHWQRAYFDFGITGGGLFYDQSRFINDNLALSDGRYLGRSWAEADYDSWFISPEISVATDLAIAEGLILTPAAGVRYAAQWLDGYAESGSAANARVGSRTLGLVEGRVEIGATKSFARGSLTGRVGYRARASVGDDSVGIALIGVNNDVFFDDIDDGAGYAGIGTVIDVGSSARLELDANAVFGGDATGYGGMARLVGRF